MSDRSAAICCRRRAANIYADREGRGFSTCGATRLRNWSRLLSTSSPRPGSVHVNRARLMIDTRKWLLSKMLPKVYGDHVTVAGDKNPDQQRAIRRIRELRRNGLSLRAIAATVAAEGVKLSLEGVKNVLAAVGDANAT
jgi:hypothetical protein